MVAKQESQIIPGIAKLSHVEKLVRWRASGHERSVKRLSEAEEGPIETTVLAELLIADMVISGIKIIKPCVNKNNICEYASKKGCTKETHSWQNMETTIKESGVIFEDNSVVCPKQSGVLHVTRSNGSSNGHA